MAYNGHKSWAAWNVSLWINNDEALYRMARAAILITSNRDNAARMMLDELNDAGTTETPDGARYTVSSITAAMRGM